MKLKPARFIAVTVGTVLVVSIVGVAYLSAKPPKPSNLSCCYVLAENLYTSPLSSTLPLSGAIQESPYVYAFTPDRLLVAEYGTGMVHSFPIEYQTVPVGTDVFASQPGALQRGLPDLGSYRQRHRLAVASDGSGSYALYRMDGQLWLVKGGIWSIDSLHATNETTLADIDRALAAYTAHPPLSPDQQWHDNQMRLADVYALARRGWDLGLADFDPFVYTMVGKGFTTRMYEVVGADTVFVQTDAGSLKATELLSRRAVDPAQTIDLRSGFTQVAAYLSPLHPFQDITIEDPFFGTEGRELIYDYEYDQCRYYLSTTRADQVFVIFSGGERLPLKQALEERRTTVEELIAHGMSNIFMVPVTNPLGGFFTGLHHRHTFTLDGESFYPSKSFMYLVDDQVQTYFDIDELSEILSMYGHDTDLRQAVDPTAITRIARSDYVPESALNQAGVATEIGWVHSSHTPVEFRTAQ